MKRIIQRPKKCELSGGWQISTRKTFLGEVRKSFSWQKEHDSDADNGDDNEDDDDDDHQV